MTVRDFALLYMALLVLIALGLMRFLIPSIRKSFDRIEAERNASGEDGL